MSLGKTISELRKKKQFKQSELAEKLGIHQTPVTRWETDKVRPRRKTLEKLAEVLGVPIEELAIADLNRLPSTLNDPELAELMQNIPKLGEPQRVALKTFLRDMLKLTELQTVLKR